MALHRVTRCLRLTFLQNESLQTSVSDSNSVYLASNGQENDGRRAHRRDMILRYNSLCADLANDDVPDPESTLVFLGVSGVPDLFRVAGIARLVMCRSRGNETL